MSKDVQHLMNSDQLGRKIKVQLPGGERELDIYTEEGFEALASLWIRSGWERKLSYELTWLGVPVIQLPEDLLMLQELIWKVRPDVIIESGVAHGGALIMYASLLELLGRGRILGLDIEIRKYNRLAIESHPLSKRIRLIEGSSIDPATIEQVVAAVRPGDTVMVMLDSDHSYEHVRAELELYAPIVSPGSYIVVFDGVMEAVADAPRGSMDWTSNNPKRAVTDFLKGHPEFHVDKKYERLRVTYCRDGFLQKESDINHNERPPGTHEG